MSEHECEYQLEGDRRYYYCECGETGPGIEDLWKERIENQSRIKALEGDIIEIDKTVNARISSLRRRITEDVLLTQGKEAKIRYAISELCDLQQIISSEFLVKLGAISSEGTEVKDG